MGPGKFWQSSAIALIMMMSVPSKGHAEEVISVQIPKQDMVGAITRLGDIAGIQIIGPDELLANRKSASVSGTMTVRSALSAILNNETFRISELNDGTLVISDNVQAQIASSNDETVLDRIVVSGERIERSVFDTASSVFVTTAQDLEEKPEIEEVDDVLENTPNIALFGTSNLGPVIRGQSTAGPITGAGGIAGSVPRATTTIDGRPLTFNEFIFGSTGLWDVEAVEVFVGPQTTSQGPNSIAGGIYVRTKDPTFTPEVGVQASFSSFDGVRLSAVSSGPLIEDELAYRASVDYRMRDTFIDYTNPATFNTAFNPFELDNLNGRFKLLWEPSEISGFSSKITYNHLDMSQPQNEQIQPPFVNFNNAGSTSQVENTSDTVIHDLQFDASGSVTIKNRFSYTDYDSSLASDFNGLLVSRQNGEDISNETTATFEAMDGRLTGLFGVYYRSIDEDQNGIFQVPAGSFFITTNQNFVDEKESFGVFGEATYQITDRLDFTAGLRFQQDDRTRIGMVELPTPGGVVPVNFAFEDSFEEFLPKFALGYDVNDELRIGATVSRGYTPGGFAFDFRSLLMPTPAIVPFDAETSWNYELFSRAEFMGGQLIVNSNVFYTRFENAQRLVTFPLPLPINAAIVINAEDAQSYGAEVSFDYRPNEVFRIFGNAGLLQTEILEFNPGAGGQNFTGNEFALSPSFTGTIGAEWEFIEDWRISGQIRYADEYFSDDANTGFLEVDSYSVTDFRLSYSPNDDLNVFAYVNNAFDDIIPLTLISNFAGTAVGGATVATPREYGAGFRAKF
ncbi:MAG: TonB-dependent receptor [Pseudomonadota bacterium]